MKRNFVVNGILTSFLVIGLVLSFPFFGIKGDTPSIVKADYVTGAGPVVGSNLFYNYTGWTKGGIKNFDPIFILIKSQVTKAAGPLNANNYPTFTTTYPNLLTDVNGDGLPDLILTNYIKDQVVKPGDGNLYYNNQYYYALLLNKGNMDYEVKYRCVYIEDTAYPTKNGYYGDCVQ